MELILELVGKGIADFHRVDVGKLATRIAHAAARGAEAGTGTAEVPALCRGFGKNGLELVGLRAEENQVARRTVEVGQSAAIFIPNVHELTQCA